jgi:hypothetical protein
MLEVGSHPGMTMTGFLVFVALGAAVVDLAEVGVV